MRSSSSSPRYVRTFATSAARLSAVAAALITLFSGFTGLSTASATTLPSPTTLLSQMTKAFATMTSVHLVITATQTSPKVTETISQNSGRGSGSQYVATGGEHASVLLTPKNAYLSGNSSGLTAFFALPADDLLLVGSKWIVIKAGAVQYKTFVSTIGIQNLLKSIVPTSKPLSIHATIYHKIPVYSLYWLIKGTSATTKLTLLLPQHGKVLPIIESAISGTTTETSTLSAWNRPVNITAPTNTISITKLHTT